MRAGLRRGEAALGGLAGHGPLSFPFSRFKRKYKVKLVEKRAFREIQ